MYRVLQAAPSDGPQVQKNSDVVTVYYKGTLINGKVFDQTKPEEPATFQVGGVIPGWTEALKLMKTGDTWELVIPSDLAYGSDGVGGCHSAQPDAGLSCVADQGRIRAVAGKSVFAYKTASKSGETMRFLKVLVLVPLVVLAACDQKKSDTAGADAGMAGSAYDTSADANKRFLADYAGAPGREEAAGRADVPGAEVRRWPAGPAATATW